MSCNRRVYKRKPILMHYLLCYLCFKWVHFLGLKIKSSFSISKAGISAEFLHKQVPTCSLGPIPLLQAKVSSFGEFLLAFLSCQLIRSPNHWLRYWVKRWCKQFNLWHIDDQNTKTLCSVTNTHHKMYWPALVCATYTTACCFLLEKRQTATIFENSLKWGFENKKGGNITEHSTVPAIS